MTSLGADSALSEKLKWVHVRIPDLTSDSFRAMSDSGATICVGKSEIWQKICSRTANLNIEACQRVDIEVGNGEIVFVNSRVPIAIEHAFLGPPSRVKTHIYLIENCPHSLVLSNKVCEKLGLETVLRDQVTNVIYTRDQHEVLACPEIDSLVERYDINHEISHVPNFESPESTISPTST